MINISKSLKESKAINIIKNIKLNKVINIIKSVIWSTIAILFKVFKLLYIRYYLS